MFCCHEYFTYDIYRYSRNFMHSADLRKKDYVENFIGFKIWDFAFKCKGIWSLHTKPISIHTNRNRIKNLRVFCKNSTKWTFLFIYIHVKFSENQQFWELSVSFFKLLQTDICSDPHELVIELEWILARNIFRGTENESKKVHFKNPNKSCYNSSTFLQYTSLNIHNSTNNKCLQDF